VWCGLGFHYAFLDHHSSGNLLIKKASEEGKPRAIHLVILDGLIGVSSSPRIMLTYHGGLHLMIRKRVGFDSRVRLLRRRLSLGFLVEFERPLFDFQFNNVLEVPTVIGLMIINPVVCAELRQVCSSKVLLFYLKGLWLFRPL